MFEEELKYVQDYLISHNGDNSPRINETFRHRSKHVNNVFRWALRIYNELDYLLQAKIDQNALYLACIFHDVGYGSEHFHNSHPIEGADIWKEYAISRHFDTELIDYVYYLIRKVPAGTRRSVSPKITLKSVKSRCSVNEQRSASVVISVPCKSFSYFSCLLRTKAVQFSLTFRLHCHNGFHFFSNRTYLISAACTP